MLGKSACLEATSCHGLNMMLMGFILSSFVSESQKALAQGVDQLGLTGLSVP